MAATIKANLTSIVNIARARGATSVGMATITPNVALTGPQNTIRSTVNTAVLNLSLGHDWSVDADTAVDPTHTNAVPAAYGGPIHLNATGLYQIFQVIPTRF